MTSFQTDVAIVLIGRNEGARLIASLASIPAWVRPVVYVDSGSTDGSIAAAEAAGARLVELDLTRPFTAARARNEGFAALGAEAPEFVQFIDGDCSLAEGWIETARAFLKSQPVAAAACGRRRERFPDATLWNGLCDAEWDTPTGKAKACGGDMLMRTSAFRQVGGFNSTLIAGEEPELCVRLRAAGWEIWRLDAEMTLHDAAMTRFSQWWRRSRRTGHSFAEGAHLHGAPPERHWVDETRRALVWGAVLPIATLALMIVTPWAGLLFLAYPVQVIRIQRWFGWNQAFFLTLGKFPEALGALEFHWGRLRGAKRSLIEYK